MAVEDELDRETYGDLHPPSGGGGLLPGLLPVCGGIFFHLYSCGVVYSLSGGDLHLGCGGELLTAVLMPRTTVNWPGRILLNLLTHPTLPFTLPWTVT